MTDGNKRLAVLWFEICCTVEELHPNPPIPLDVLAIAIEQSALPMHELVSAVAELLFDGGK